MNQTSDLIGDLNKTKQELEKLIAETKKAKQELEFVLGYAGSLIKYGAICYTQLKTNNVADGIFTIRYPYDQLPNNGLIFLVPQFNSIPYQEKHYNKLVVRFPQLRQDGTMSYTGIKSYNMIKEDSNGHHSPVTKGDILANRLAIFRFITGDDNTVILVNNPQYNDIYTSSLHVTNNAIFDSIPIVYKEDSTPIQLATAEDTLNLEKRIKVLESKFIYGTENADKALYDAPEGTIYIKVEEN